MYQNQLPNMFQFQAPTNYPTINQLIRVTGIDGAKAYQMSANSTVALFDSGSDVMYIKSTDGACFPTIRTFKFEEVHNNEQVNATEYAEKYLELKAENSSFSAKYKTLAEDELRHAMVVHEYVVYKISELNRIYTPPVEMQEIWDKSHAKYIERTAWIKQMLTM